jgi:hypothetical protein
MLTQEAVFASCGYLTVRMQTVHTLSESLALQHRAKTCHSSSIFRVCRKEFTKPWAKLTLLSADINRELLRVKLVSLRCG